MTDAFLLVHGNTVNYSGVKYIGLGIPSSIKIDTAGLWLQPLLPSLNSVRETFPLILRNNLLGVVCYVQTAEPNSCFKWKQYEWHKATLTYTFIKTVVLQTHGKDYIFTKSILKYLSWYFYDQIF